MKNKNYWLINRTGLLTSFKVRQTIINVLRLSFIFIIFIAPFEAVKALPSYARQTQLSCTACHTSFPELNSFGRMFKANGYTLTTASTINDQSGDTLKPKTRLNLLNNLPLSVMVQSSFTSIAKDVVGQQNNSGQFPQQLSMFFAGQITPHIGSFIQMTYADGSFGMDNADIRYANTTNFGSNSLLYGLTLNNNPTSQDLWNTSPAWRFPYASAATAPSPAKSALIESLGGQVIGVGAYGLFNDLVFAEFTTYRSAQIGSHNPPDTTNTNVVKGFIPYWRLALQHQWGLNYLELGTSGIASTQYLTGISGALDKFVDIGVDLQYERSLPFGSLSLHSSFVNENEVRDLSAETNYNFQSFKVDGNLFFKNGTGGTIGYFNNTGSADIANFPNGNNKPNSSGFIFQIEYLPWYNTKFAAQYVAYQKFDGSSTNYDGMGRNAGNNNTIYLLAWLCF
ncbi:MAG: hypothetical protein P4L34_04045 [Paludibacter sp.]|nr:hypothetical protein [Paludibacter sp.]